MRSPSPTIHCSQNSSGWLSRQREVILCARSCGYRRATRSVKELASCGHSVSANTVGRLLVEELAYSRQAIRKTHEGSNHADRNAQFEETIGPNEYGIDPVRR